MNDGSAWYHSFFCEWYFRFADAMYEPLLQREISFLAAIASQFGIRTVLELGSGTGKHAIALSKAAHINVTGYDVSEWAIESSIQAAKGSPGLRTHFHKGDLLASPWPVTQGGFDAAVALRSFGWGSDEDQALLLRRTGAALSDGGLLVLDVPSLTGIVRNFRSNQVDVIGSKVYRIKRSMDVTTGRVNGFFRVCSEATGEQLFSAHDSNRIYSLPEICGLLERTGFRIELICGEYSLGSVPTLDSQHVQVIARFNSPSVGSRGDGVH